MTNDLKMDELLMEAVNLGASDLHLTTGLPPIVRVSGSLKALDGHAVLKPADTSELVYSIMRPDIRERYEEAGEVDFSHGIAGVARFRVNAYTQRGSVGAAFRVIPTKIRSLEELGLPSVVRTFADKTRGMVLVTGPTGSGKSTTLASLIDIINSERACHVITLEDPIEYLHKHRKSMINQREVGTDTQSFGAALRAALREDPDVILVGEMRDLETTSIALTAAETGHLVFATLHTNDTVQTVDRIIDQYPPHQQQQVRVQLASVLQGGTISGSAAKGGRTGKDRGGGGSRGHAGSAQPHTRREDTSDLLGASDRGQIRDGEPRHVLGRLGEARNDHLGRCVDPCDEP